jgi:Lipoxygenase
MHTYIIGDRFSWLRDEEFARETLAGVNPYAIQLVKVDSFLWHAEISSLN